jgi:hypothetical protein
MALVERVTTLIRTNVSELIEHAERQETIIRRIILVAAKHTSLLRWHHAKKNLEIETTAV